MPGTSQSSSPLCIFCCSKTQVRYHRPISNSRLRCPALAPSNTLLRSNRQGRARHDQIPPNTPWFRCGYFKPQVVETYNTTSCLTAMYGDASRRLYNLKFTQQLREASWCGEHQIPFLKPSKQEIRLVRFKVSLPGNQPVLL
jgi:hypothetical protein